MKNTPDNRERLALCPGPHHFVRVPGARVRETFRCQRCFGFADRLFVESFLEGVRAGKAIARGEMPGPRHDDADAVSGIAAGSLS